MNPFDIIGPVMVGPSSSHTAGVVRIGNVTANMLGAVPRRVRVTFHGSFSATYRGHGSDKAIIAGLMGFTTDDERIPNSITLARQSGMEIQFLTADIPCVHPNTLIVDAQKNDAARVVILGESTGGGNIRIRAINGVEVEYTGRYDTLFITHRDTPGAIALVTKLLAEQHINIAYMKVYRAKKGGDAIMLIEADGRIGKSIERRCIAMPPIQKATVISKL